MHAASTLVNREPDQLIAWAQAGPLSVTQFTRAVRHAAEQLHDRKFVFNLYANPVDYLLGFCASTLAGQCTLMPPNRLQKTLDDIRSDYPDSYFLGPEGSGGLDIRDCLTGADEPGIGGLDLPPIPDTQLTAIAFTSGSTGSPSPNLKYWRTLREGTLSNVAMMLRGIEGPVNMVSTVPPQHMWGLENSVLLPLFSDTSIAYQSPFYPQDLKDALQSFPAPRVLVSTPVHLATIAGSGLDFEPVKRVLCATAPLSLSLATAVESLFGGELLEVFGCTESGIIASRFRTREEEWTLADAFSLDVHSGHSIISAAHLPDEVRLQDIVEKTADQRFRWLGRHQDLVNIAGKRGSLVDLNRRLESIPGVVDGVMFFPTDEHKRLAALVVAPELGPADIREALRRQVEPAFLPRPIVKVDHLPRSATGKLTRKALLDLFERVKPGAGALP